MLRTKISSVYQERRDRLMSKHPGACFLFPSPALVTRNGDVEHSFRQDSHFYYLTGFDEPCSFLILAPCKSQPGSHKMTFFVQPKDLEKEIWDGERYGVDGAKSIFAADEVYVIGELEQKIAECIHDADDVFYHLGLDEQADRLVLKALDQNRRKFGRTGRGILPVSDSFEAVGELRLFKDTHETELLRKACGISAQAHVQAMKQSRPGMNECEIEALVNYEFSRLGCKRLGYGSIVAGGKNATCLHYTANNETLVDHQMLLIDAGGEYEYYTADITRTFPIGREFTKPQQTVYEWVLRAQKEALKMVRPGITIPKIHERVCEILIEGMLSMGLLKGSAKEHLKAGTFKQFYPHSTSHWLGMDVHDVGLYLINGEPRPLEAGMVFTIEPGLYIRPALGAGGSSIPESFLHIGVRIEDDILVTQEGYENFSHAAPKEVSDLLALKA